jgi:hypothetical protein
MKEDKPLHHTLRIYKEERAFWQRVRHRCLDEGISIRQQIFKLLKDWLSKPLPKEKGR